MNAEKVLNVKEVAERLGLKPRTVGNMLARKEIRGWKVNGYNYWRVYESDLDKYINERINK